MTDFNRRCFLATATAPFVLRRVRADADATIPTIGFAFGTYGMKSLTTSEALRVCAEIGYDGVELALMQGWPTEPSLLTKQKRSEVRRQLTDLQLAVPSLLEDLRCLGTDEQHSTNLEKLKRATQLAHDLSPSSPASVQSTTGGTVAQWEQSKDRLVEQLSDFAEIGESTGTVICFKPHVAQAVHNADRAIWIHRRIGSRWLKIVYDYSHLFLEGLTLAGSLKQLLPIAHHLQIKDSRGTPDKYEYLLPGDGETNYSELFSILKDTQFSGFVAVEVSAMVHKKTDYDPVATARLCYSRFAPLMNNVGICRPKPSA
ncbi:MAG: sugar phosphate isomerase/epimerase [Fuerstiella sp.]|nr:sugar phosphate isomerase/epimerase [Fuerstiella sp.]